MVRGPAAAGRPTVPNAHWLRVYKLRHNSATLGIEAGEGLKTVSERLGHSTITLTANVYSHVGDGTKRKAAVAREALLFGPAAAVR